MSRPFQHATKFHAELWTTISGNGFSHEQWACIMDDGPETGQLCAIGSKSNMEAYAEKLNLLEGVLS